MATTAALRIRNPDSVTEILHELNRGGTSLQQSLESIYTLIYDELRRIARGLMQHERRACTLQPTALVNEAYFKLLRLRGITWRNRSHFFGIATRAMRQILVEHARRRLAQKRGGGMDHVGGSKADEATQTVSLDTAALETIAVDEALQRLAAMDARMARVVEMRVFAGSTMEQIAVVLGVSRRTVYNDWDVAKRWLQRELRAGSAA